MELVEKSDDVKKTFGEPLKVVSPHTAHTCRCRKAVCACFVSEVLCVHVVTELEVGWRAATNICCRAHPHQRPQSHGAHPALFCHFIRSRPPDGSGDTRRVCACVRVCVVVSQGVVFGKAVKLAGEDKWLVLICEVKEDGVPVLPSEQQQQQQHAQATATRSIDIIPSPIEPLPRPTGPPTLA